MLLSLAVALLSVTPAPSHVSLLASDAPVLPAAARVLTQAPPEATPRTVSPELEARIQDVTQQVKALSLRIDAVDTRWPGSSAFMATLGVIMSGFAVVLLPFATFGGALWGDDNSLIPIALMGGAGVTLLALGVTTGESATEPARQQRDELMRERDALRRELRGLKQERKRQQTGLAERPFAHVSLVSLAF